MSVQTAQELAARVRLITGNATDTERAAIQAESVTETRLIDPFGMRFAQDIASPLEPIEWLCEGLGIARSTYVVFAGSAYSGKSLCLADLALSVASGGRAFDMWQCMQGQVFWLDYDGQGWRTSRERFQRMARVKGIDLAELGDQLGYAWMPRIKLDSGDAEERFRKLLTGVKLLIVDSWRGGATDTDEHSRAEVQKVGELLMRLAQELSCAIIIIDHTVKPPVDGKSERSKMHDIHGSSAKGELAELIWSVTEQNTETTLGAKLKNTKNRVNGKPCGAFQVRYSDVERDGAARWGLQVSLLDPEQLQREEEAREAAIVAAARHRVVGWLSRHAGRFQGSRKDLANEVGGRYANTWAGIGALIRDGELTCDGRGESALWTLRRPQ